MDIHTVVDCLAETAFKPKGVREKIKDSAPYQISTTGRFKDIRGTGRVSASKVEESYLLSIEGLPDGSHPTRVLPINEIRVEDIWQFCLDVFGEKEEQRRFFFKHRRTH